MLARERAKNKNKKCERKKSHDEYCDMSMAFDTLMKIAALINLVLSVEIKSIFDMVLSLDCAIKWPIQDNGE